MGGQTLHSQTGRNPAGISLSVMDYIPPISGFYSLNNKLLNTSVRPTMCQVTGGLQPESNVAAAGEQVVIVCFF